MENRQGEGKNSVGNVEAKELMTHGHELWGGGECGREGVGQDGVEWSGGGGNGTTVIA